jgi:hypothetical protein
MFSFFKKKPPVAVAPPARDMRDFGLDQPEREILIAPEFIPQAALKQRWQKRKLKKNGLADSSRVWPARAAISLVCLVLARSMNPYLKGWKMHY